MIEIVPYAERHREGVIALILPIQQAEFDIPVTLEAQPDLLDVPAFYRKGSGNFWVALSGAELVVGTIGLLDIGNGEGALRKMFVAAPLRGAAQGVAQRLLIMLLHWCGTHDIRSVYLGTTDKFRAAHRFYEKNGFAVIPKRKLPPAFPVMSVDTKFYCLALNGPPQGRAREQAR
jgi:N-acetylglutamate synthase-like GNAT family acetyltransferase